jgi:hypothetical protein
MSKESGKQNEISHLHHERPNLAEREDDIVAEVSESIGYKPEKLMGRSHWWGSKEYGAFHYEGSFESKPAVLKVQGVKPATSEVETIKAFKEANRSKLIRPPYIYASIPWNEDLSYEAFVMEKVEGEKVVHIPFKEGELDTFFMLYDDYRKNAGLETPWVDKPEMSTSEMVKGRFTSWIRSRAEIYPDHPLIEKEDDELIDQAVETLMKGYENVELEFVHGHFGTGDVIKSGGDYVMLSNLYWTWRPPVYDSIFGYHWYRYIVIGSEGVTKEVLEKHKEVWMGKINNIPQVQGEEGQRLFKLALLERAAAGLNLDALVSDPQLDISRYSVEKTREETKSLINELNSK